MECEETRTAIQEQRQEIAQEHNETILDSLPEWVQEPPRPDGTGVYAVGIADSSKMKTAINKSRLDGEFGLAKQLNQELSGSERLYEQDNDADSVSQQYTQLIDKLVQAVPVVGFEVVDQELHSIDGRFHSYVLLKMPYEEFNKVLQQKRADSRDKTIQAAFDDLERRLDKRRSQRLEEQQLDQKMEMDALQQRHDLMKPEQQAEEQTSDVEGELEDVEEADKSA